MGAFYHKRAALGSPKRARLMQQNFATEKPNPFNGLGLLQKS